MLEFSTLISILIWIITGSIAGYFASLLLRAERQGCLINLAVGIVGALVGGFVMGNLLGFRLFKPEFLWGLGGFLDGIIHAIVGAVIVLILIEIVVPGKQLGVRGEKRTRKRRRR